MGKDNTLRIYLSREKHNLGINFIEQWEKEGRNISDMMLRGAELLGTREQMAISPILDSYVEQERKREEKNRRIDEFMILVECFGGSKDAADMHVLLEQYDIEQLKKLNSAAAILHYKLDNALTLHAGR